jgi:RimJ/RimL family protein N-acetyltransferase
MSEPDEYLFFAMTGRVNVGGEVDERVTFWRPSWTEVRPDGLTGRAALVWWAFDRFGVFSNENYAIAVVRDGDRLVHRSYVFPGYFRFPFMAPNDLQIGDTWTDPAARGRGLATAAIRAVVTRYAAAGRMLWYVVDRGNVPSVRAIQRAGFSLVGRGRRVSRFGFRVFGRYQLSSSVLGGRAADLG